MLYIKVPASTSNLGSGFDAFGLSLELYNHFYVDFGDRYVVEIEGYGGELPRDEKNLFIRAYRRACETFGLKEEPITLKQINQIPTARGLGSSATAIVGGIVSCIKLHSLRVQLEDVLKVAFEFEPHPDNLLPALLGGFVVCAVEDGRVSYLKLNFPEELSVVLCIPQFELSTEKARAVLRRDVPLSDAVFNLQRSALLVGALLSRRFDLLKEAVKDRLHQPYRSHLVPGFHRVVERAYEAGALAVFLSGAGPTVAGFSFDGEEVGKAMTQAFQEEGIKAEYMVLDVSYEGAYP
ncbi:MAG: homoserine kinase [Acidobacteria bacterium]|jgi:homoserine kinase|nr:MAG: homoserine kinase [Acidobacteriota bacterium]